MPKEIRIKLIRSGIGRPKKHRLILAGLGLTRPNRVVTRQDTREIRGMIRKVSHLVEVIE
ncbi:MAG: 50S ribosomal protein L30 [Deltaproteobacteria bacterium]|nr:50S ribosomal protein L30 [Deltaproteobacteria bacterium]MBW2120728.1 50S ribosomal protein L30 [Deltaproteobacteria bacterium]